jgi:hypothetical protein
VVPCPPRLKPIGYKTPTERACPDKLLMYRRILTHPTAIQLHQKISNPNPTHPFTHSQKAQQPSKQYGRFSSPVSRFIVCPGLTIPIRGILGHFQHSNRRASSSAVVLFVLRSVTFPHSQFIGSRNPPVPAVVGVASSSLHRGCKLASHSVPLGGEFVGCFGGGGAGVAIDRSRSHVPDRQIVLLLSFRRSALFCCGVDHPNHPASQVECFTSDPRPNGSPKNGRNGVHNSPKARYGRLYRNDEKSDASPGGLSLR